MISFFHFFRGNSHRLIGRHPDDMTKVTTAAESFQSAFGISLKASASDKI
jgi:hypothetical protein